ncbi:MAG: serine/threonine-protein kinase, partial [Pseudomonadota bacterium]
MPDTDDPKRGVDDGSNEPIENPAAATSASDGSGATREAGAAQGGIEEELPQGFPNYRVEARIGAGAMGAVLLAEELGELRRSVALKVIHPHYSSPEFIARFQSERHALAQLSHRNIASVYGTGQSQAGLPFFAMEYVPGTTIDRFCDDQRLGIDDRIRLYRQVCAGVLHAHQKGVIHRDLKPSNVLVHAVDGRPEVKIIDFGIAKLEERIQPADHRATEAGTVLGTKQYMSPEQAGRRPEDVDARSDIYSLGAMLYELLVGRPPFDGRVLSSLTDEQLTEFFADNTLPTPTERLDALKPMLDRIAASRRTTPTQLRRKLSRSLSWILARALSVDPEHRYPSVTAFTDDLNRYLDNQPVEAGPPSRSYRVRKFVRRHRAAVAGATVLLLAVVLGLAGTMVGMLRAQEAEARALQEARTSAQVVDFLISLFEVSDPEEGAGSRVTARELLDQGERNVLGGLEDEPLIRARMMQTMGEIYRKLGLYPRAEALASGAVGLYDAVDDEPPEALADSLITLGMVQSETAQYDRARENLSRSLEVGQAHGLGTVAKAMFGLGDLAFLEADYDRSAAILEESLALRRGALGASHEDTAAIKNKLANVYSFQGRYDEAERLHLEALRDLEAARGPNHPHVAGTAMLLASVYGDIGRFEDAERLNARALDIWVDTLGPEHPNVATTYNNLANVLLRQNRHEEAAEAYTTALEIRAQVYGLDHPRYADSLHNLGIVAFEAGDLDLAESRFDAGLAIRRAALGPNHIDIAKSLNSLGLVAQNRGDFSTAREHLEASLAIKEQALGTDHGEILPAVNNLATVALSLGDVAASLAYFERGLVIGQEALGPNHPDMVMQAFNMAAINNYIENYTESERLQRIALAGYIELQGADSLDAAESRYALGIAIGFQGRLDEASALFDEALPVMRAELGENNARLGAFFVQEAGMYARSGEHQRAIDRLDETLQIYTAALEPDHPEIGTALLGRGQALVA